MSELFKVTDDKNGDQEITSISFDPIPINSSSTERVFIQNKTSAVLHLKETLSETDGPGEIEILNSPDNIAEEDFEAIELQARSISNNQLQGLEASISIEATAVIQP